jgi:mRNA-degrading endonuclease RelE of RelBE toxin-antitoxin system
MAWTILVARAAQKQLIRFPANDQKKIAAALRSLSEDPFSGDILKLEGADKRWRRRIGSYRIFLAVDAATKTVSVSAIARRTSRTY